MLQKAGDAKNKTVEAEGLESIQLAVMASCDDKGINITSLAKNLSEINGLTDTNNQVISEDTTITLPKSVKLNNTKYDIKKDGTVIINNKILPEEYEQVEYIESSGTQYIDTDISLKKEKTSVKAKFKIVEINTAITPICGVLQNGYGWQMAYYQNNFISNIEVSSEDPYDIIEASIINGGDRNTQNNFIIFGRRTSLNISDWYLSKICIYDIFISNGEKSIKLIPCYSTTTVTDVNGKQCLAGTIGMYDTVTGQFYTNQGTGTFGYETLDGTYVAPSPTNN